MGYHELNGFSSITPASLRIHRARLVLRAVEKNRDFSLVEVLERGKQGFHHEVLVVDVECDGVPPENPFGIRYRERLALCVSSEEKSLVEVLALREDFPVLMHQNMMPPGAPASLCLYFEPVPSVLRTWTPEKFLRRIQWWLEKSATDELHPADQPLEHLFFASKYELILPWNLDDIRSEGNSSFEVIRTDPRPDNGLTCFLCPVEKPHKKKRETYYLELDMPSIVHGEIESDPPTLQELVELFERRGVDFLPKLRNSIRDAVGAHGVKESEDSANVVLLLRIPISRDKDRQPESIVHRAFLIPTGHLALGEEIGALFKLEGEYFRDVLGDPAKSKPSSQPVYSMQVLKINDGATSRLQSGISERGPEGVLIGAGSLGSAMLNFWARSGWGNWVVVDVDHVKPHNLSRHIAFVQHIGEPKASVITSLVEEATQGAISVTPLVHDATNFENSVFLKHCSLSMAIYFDPPLANKIDPPFIVYLVAFCFSR